MTFIGDWADESLLGRVLKDSDFKKITWEELRNILWINLVFMLGRSVCYFVDVKCHVPTDATVTIGCKKRNTER